ncbi:hypothetical protein SARC_12441 [Sphaeroforma arctica JP610]|uniref:RGS domain-containing protein n=1 Tax=Sphaeroforma arctica JP610 TaxID=667725 RepID=A0A0L0FE46_9EUKA|nr:hypothetical protein SARC_12441 [Sphaeroforma arctica JP610]KNC75025.1 hypothetical protein SARC_12441 [Sphaeroforma arctica JP610]|eukprot:XP_014148927.1 hypothetical protein SARC_12441 [Sphaeroforma arctica JP610]
MLAYCHRRHRPEQMQFLLALHGLNEGVGPNARRTGTIFETENTHNHTGNTVDECYMNTEEGVEAIAAMYVRPESEREVNLPQILRDRLLKRIEEKDNEDITVLFQEAYNEISLMISRNLLSDFIHTEAYKAFAANKRMMNRSWIFCQA